MWHKCWRVPSTLLTPAFSVVHSPLCSPTMLADQDDSSNGISRRAILQPPDNARLHPRYLHTPPLFSHAPRKDNRPPSTCRCDFPNSLRIRLFPRSLIFIILSTTSRPTKSLQETLPNLHSRSLRPTLSNVQTHPLPRPPERTTTRSQQSASPRSRRPTLTRPTTTPATH